MKRTTCIIAAIAAAGLTITGCSSDEPETAVTVTETAASDYTEPEPETVGSDYDYATETESESDDSALHSAAMDLAWDELGTEGQVSICDGWEIDKDFVIDAFVESSEVDIDRSTIRTFFDGKCI